MNKVKEALYEKVKYIPVIDTHEHTPGSNAKRVHPYDVFCEYLPGYLNRDLRNAGLSFKDFEYLLEPGHTVMEKWDKVEEYWEYSRCTGYVQMFDRAVRDLYGLDGVKRDTILELNEALLKTHDTDHYRTIFHDKCNIKAVLVNNNDPESDPEFFRFIFTINFMIFPITEADIAQLEEYLDHPASCLDDWLEGCTIALRAALANGATAFKCWLAYQRTLHFGRPTYSEAEAAFNEMMRDVHGLPIEVAHPVHAPKAFCDYVMHYVLREVQRLNAVIQVHTGYLDGVGGRLEDTDPALLNNLFIDYPGIRFDLFHIGYPYQEKAIALCKMFPNVYLDFCWTHVLSPEAARNTLKESLLTLPANKILAFGGDHNRAVDAIYGHLLMAKENAVDVFADLIERGIMDLDRAYWMLDRIFYENAVSLFDLKFD